MTHAYFPTSGMISRVERVAPASVESATIGSEGMLGLALFLGESVAAADWRVRIRGEAWRLPALSFLDLVERSSLFATTLKRYTSARLLVTYRSAGCSLLHSLPRRSARWLLFAHDCTQGDSFELTHADLAQLMGVRRAGVTLALGHLQREGIISSRRGKITVLDRGHLEAEACECAAMIHSRYASQP